MDRDLHAIERIVAQERDRRSSQLRVIFVLTLCVTLSVGGIAYLLKELASAKPQPVQVDVARLPPARATPGQ